MKRQIYTLSLVVTILALSPVSEAVAQTCVAPPSGLVSWWPGDVNADDIAGANNGALQADATFATGKVGQAFSFDGSLDRVVVPDSATLDITGAITVDAWIKTAGTDDFSGIVAKILSGEPRTGYLLGVDNLSRFRCDIILARPPQGTVVSTTLVDDNTLHHVACTYDGAIVKVYVDGTLEGQLAYIDGDPGPEGVGVNGLGENNEPLLIGRDPCCPNRDFNGLIDEVEVYNRALDAGEIQAIFAAGVSGKCNVTIDIKPGSDPNSINLGSAGVIPVAILSTDKFDATEVDPLSVDLNGASIKLVGKKERALCHQDFVNDDSLLDLVCQIEIHDFLIELGETEAMLTAETFAGQQIRGKDAVNIVPNSN